MKSEHNGQQGWSHVETVLAIAILGAIAWIVTSPERTASSIKIGMSKDEAVAAVGRPAKWEGSALPLCQDNSWDRCPDVKNSGAVLFLIWHTFVDSDLIVGLCADGRVCFKGQRG